MKCDLGTHCLSYDLSGPEDAPVVLLGHCFGSDRHFWDAQLPVLTDYRTLCYDTRGHGESDTPPGPYRLDDLGDDVIGLLDRLGVEQVHYVGVSMGGMIGQNLALRYPHRLSSLGLINTIPTYDEAGRQGWRDRVDWVRRDGAASLHDVLIARWFTEVAVAESAPGVRYMSAAYRSFSDIAFEWIAHAIIHDLDYAADLDRIVMPTLVVASPDDPGVPREMSELMRDKIPGAEFVWITPSYHLATLEHPERFNALLVAFLAKHAS